MREILQKFAKSFFRKPNCLSLELWTSERRCNRIETFESCRYLKTSGLQNDASLIQLCVFEMRHRYRRERTFLSLGYLPTPPVSAVLRLASGNLKNEGHSWFRGKPGWKPSSMVHDAKSSLAYTRPSYVVNWYLRFKNWNFPVNYPGGEVQVNTMSVRT